MVILLFSLFLTSLNYSIMYLVYVHKGEPEDSKAGDPKKIGELGYSTPECPLKDLGSGWSNADIQILYEIFPRYDIDNDGVISGKEELEMLTLNFFHKTKHHITTSLFNDALSKVAEHGGFPMALEEFQVWSWGLSVSDVD